MTLCAIREQQGRSIDPVPVLESAPQTMQGWENNHKWSILCRFPCALSENQQGVATINVALCSSERSGEKRLRENLPEQTGGRKLSVLRID